MDEIDAVLTGGDMTFEEAETYFRQRVPVTASAFYSIAYEYRALAFTVSGYSKLQILRRFYEELLAAIEDGNTLTEFRANMNDFLEREGYGLRLGRCGLQVPGPGHRGSGNQLRR